jgi:hypothetical protein
LAGGTAEWRTKADPARLSGGRDVQASAEHLQLALSALGVNEGLMTANPIATATAILISVDICVDFFGTESRPFCGRALGHPATIKHERHGTQKRAAD